MNASRPVLVLSLLALVLGLLPAVAGAQPTPAAATASSSATAAAPAPALAAFRADGEHLVRLAGGAFDPLTQAAPVPPEVSAIDAATLPAGTPAYWIVQATAGQEAAALAAVETAGGVTAGVVPDRAWLVRATPAQRAALAGSPAVRAAVLHQPGSRLAPAAGDLPRLLDLAGEQTYRVYAFRIEPDVAAVHAAVAAVPGVTVVEQADHVLDVRATAAALPRIARITGVEWVEAKPEVQLLNAEASWVNDTGVRDLFSALLPGRLDGAGQTAAVADTGINYIPDDNGTAQVGFRDCDGGDLTTCVEADYTQAVPGNAPEELQGTVSNQTGHRKMAAYFDLGETGPNPSDTSAHGTHVGGSTAGDAGVPGVRDGNDAPAAAARLVHQNIGSPTGGLSTPGGLTTPADAYELWRQAYRPRDPASVPEAYDPDDYANYRPLEDARTHNNSYGLIAPGLSLGSAEAADRFVFEHEDMVIVSSAGNSGPSVQSIGAPSVGVNVVTSGATANGRQPMASIDTMASFSSHGPTPDGRLGVDLGTPGQVVVSTKGGTSGEYQYLQGTSMSGPLLTSLATLVRQYFWDGYGPGPATSESESFGPGTTASGVAVGSPDEARRHNPSAALVRAALVNGAQRMRGFYTGDEGSRRETDGQYPSAGQGFGLVQLEDSLSFDDEQGKSERATWFTDVYRADPDAFRIGPRTEDVITFDAPGQARAYTFEVAEGAPLDVTLAYTSPPTSLAVGTPALVNDLNLVLLSPDGLVYSGNNFNTRAVPSADEHETLPGVNPDPRNPVEKVRIPEPAAGTWSVLIENELILEGPQGFALAASGNISEVDGAPFVPGPPRQVDAPGAPGIADVVATPVDGETMKVTWTTSEPTTGLVRGLVGDEGVTWIDSFNLGTGADGREPGYQGIDEGPVETSADYADRPVLQTTHEALVTGLRPGESTTLTVEATDLAEEEARAEVEVTTPKGVVGAIPADIGQLAAGDTDALGAQLGGAGFTTGTQLYGGVSGGAGLLGAFLFRVPEAIDPDDVLGAAVQLSSAHDITNHYLDDVRVYVDLLDESVEEGWRRSTYPRIHDAPLAARTQAETGARRGGGQDYTFALGCEDLPALRDTLATVGDDGTRQAAFRYDGITTQDTSLFAMEFGFNRRSRGADLRPRLVLYLDDGTGTGVDELPCDEDAPAPTIADVGVQLGVEDGAGELTETDDAVTVSWRTDTPSDSTVLYRERGQTSFRQVGVSGRTTAHNVQVRGLDPARRYEFAVRSAACNGAVTTDGNGGAGYDFYARDGLTDGDPGESPAPEGEEVTLGGPFGFEEDADGFTAETTRNANPPGFPANRWERAGGGAEPSQFSFQVEPYFMDSDTTLTSPELESEGGRTTVDFALRIDTEEGFDSLFVDWSSDGASWTDVGAFTGENEDFPSFSPASVSFDAPAGPLFVRFRFTSDFALASETGEAGVRVDDVLVQQVVSDAPAAEEPGEEGPELATPDRGPIPVPSAGASGLDLSRVETRRMPTATERAAGTARCAPLSSDVALADAPRAPGGPGTGGPGTGGPGTGGPGTGGAGGGDLPPLPGEETRDAAGELVTRLSGAGRIQTAIELSKATFTSADAAVLARADLFPDALAAAGVADEVPGPVLLNPVNELNADVAAELQRLDVATVYVAGGTAAQAPEVAAALVDAGYEVRRLGGADRFETAGLLAREVVRLGGPIQRAVVARADAFPDALSASNLVGAGRAPILLSTTGDLPDVTRRALDQLLDEDDRVYVAGGPAAVGAESAATLEGEGYDVLRLSGPERYATAVAIAEEAVALGADRDPLFLASGTDFPDALAAGPAATRRGGLLLLTDPSDLSSSQPTADYLAEHRAEIDTVVIAGGTAAVSDDVLSAVRTATRDG